MGRPLACATGSRGLWGGWGGWGGWREPIILLGKERAFAPELLAEDAVFLLQVGDEVLLVAVEEAG